MDLDTRTPLRGAAKTQYNSIAFQAARAQAALTALQRAIEDRSPSTIRIKAREVLDAQQRIYWMTAQLLAGVPENDDPHGT